MELDAELVGPGICPPNAPPILNTRPRARFPIPWRDLASPRGNLRRHDAVAWGYARAQDRLGVDLIQKLRSHGLLDGSWTNARVSNDTRHHFRAGRVGAACRWATVRLSPNLVGIRAESNPTASSSVCQ